MNLFIRNWHYLLKFWIFDFFSIFKNMEKDLSAFKTYEELDKFFDNPLIREQIILTELKILAKSNLAC